MKTNKDNDEDDVEPRPKQHFQRNENGESY